MDQMKIGTYLKELRKESDSGTDCREIRCITKICIAMGERIYHAGYQYTD